MRDKTPNCPLEKANAVSFLVSLGDFVELMSSFHPPYAPNIMNLILRIIMSRKNAIVTYVFGLNPIEVVLSGPSFFILLVSILPRNWSGESLYFERFLIHIWYLTCPWDKQTEGLLLSLENSRPTFEWVLRELEIMSLVRRGHRSELFHVIVDWMIEVLS